MISLALTTAIALLASSSDDTVSGPRLEFDETVAELGELFQGEVRHCFFLLENTGDADLRLRDVRPSCGCTAAKILHGADFASEIPLDIERNAAKVMKNEALYVLKPGEKVKLEAAFGAGSLPAQAFHKTITVVSDAVNGTSRELALTGVVRAVVVMDPVTLNFNRVRRGEEKVLEARVKPLADEAVNIVEIVNLEAPFVKGDVRIAEEDGERLSVITITANGDGVRVGPHSRTLLLKTDHPRITEFRLPVMASVAAQVSFESGGPNPEALHFGMVPKDEGASQTVTISNHDPSQPYALLKAWIDSPHPDYFKVDVETVEPANQYRVTVTILPGYPQISVRAALVLEADHADLLEKRIGLVAFVRPKS